MVLDPDKHIRLSNLKWLAITPAAREKSLILWSPKPTCPITIGIGTTRCKPRITNPVTPQTGPASTLWKIWTSHRLDPHQRSNPSKALLNPSMNIMTGAVRGSMLCRRAISTTYLRTSRWAPTALSWRLKDTQGSTTTSSTLLRAEMERNTKISRGVLTIKTWRLIKSLMYCRNSHTNNIGTRKLWWDFCTVQATTHSFMTKWWAFHLKILKAWAYGSNVRLSKPEQESCSSRKEQTSPWTWKEAQTDNLMKARIILKSTWISWTHQNY